MLSESITKDVGSLQILERNSVMGEIGYVKGSFSFERSVKMRLIFKVARMSQRDCKEIRDKRDRDA